MTKWRSFIDPSVGDGQNTINGIIANGPTYGIGISQDLSVTGIATVTGDLYVGAKIFDGDNTFGSSGQVLSSDGTDTKWINTGSLTAGAASEVGITAVNSNSNHFITFVDSSSGNENVKVDTNLTYNPSTNTLGAINIASAVVNGNLRLNGQLKDGDNAFGGAGTVLTSDGTDTKWDNVGNLAAGSAAKLAVSEDDTETDGRLLFSNAAGQSGGNIIKSDNNLTYNASTNVLTGGTFNGGLTGNVSTTTGTSTFNNITINGEFTGTVTMGQSGKIAFPDNTTVPDDPTSQQHDYITFGAHGSISQVSGRGALMITSSDDSLILANGDVGRTFQNTDINVDPEDVFVLSDGNVRILTDLQEDFGTQHTFTFTNTGVFQVNGNNVLDSSGNISAARLPNHSAALLTSGTISAARVPTLNQNTTGSAATLTTARTIGGVSFNGSANINLPGVNQAGNQNTSGNAATATVLATARNFSISGEITASAQSFNGSGNVTLSATVDNNVIDEANLKISNSPTNGRFLQCNTGVSGGLTWAEVTVPAANTLTGTTLASGITASSITSLGTLTGLTVDGNITQTGQTTISKGFTSNTDFQLYIRQTTNGEGATVKFTDQSTQSQFGLFTYKHSDSASNSAANSFHFNSSESSTSVIIDQTSGNSGYYVGTNEVWHEGNDGPSSGLNADKLDDQDGSYYRNASNLNTGTIPDARLDDSSLFVTGMIIMYQGSTAPSGWALCDGQGGRPDLRDRFIIGSGNSYNLNATGGSSSILLGTANLPAHTHQLGGSVGNTNLGNHKHSFSKSASTNDNGAHVHSLQVANGGDDNDSDDRRLKTIFQSQQFTFSGAVNGNGAHSHSVTISGDTGNKNLGNHNHSLPSTTGNQGGTMGQSFNNLPPYYALAFIIKL